MYCERVYVYIYVAVCIIQADMIQPDVTPTSSEPSLFNPL